MLSLAFTLGCSARCCAAGSTPGRVLMVVDSRRAMNAGRDVAPEEGGAAGATRSRSHDGRGLLLIGICLCIAVGLSIIDAATPLGVNAAAFNVILVLAAIWIPWRSAAVVLAIAATLLIVIGYFISDVPDVWIAGQTPILNRGIAIVVVWVAAALVLIQKATRERLAEMQNRFRETFEQTAVGIAHVGQDGTLLLSNHCLAEILGYSDRAELGCKRLQDLAHPDDLMAHRNHVEQLIGGGLRSYNLETRFFRKDGSVVWINETVSRAREQANGQDAYLIYVMQDISERKLTDAMTGLRLMNQVMDPGQREELRQERAAAEAPPLPRRVPVATARCRPVGRFRA